MVSNAQKKGQAAEEAALLFLEKKGLQCVQRNYRTRFGEIDLVMTENNTLVFVEVRFRSHTRFGSVLETVDIRKQTKLIATAACFLEYYHVNCPTRFDVVALTAQKNTPPVFQWIKGAFDGTAYE